MFIRKPKNFTLTLFVSIALVLSIASSADAHVQHRDHVNLKRLIRKRAPAPQDPVPVAGAGAAPTNFSSTDSSSTTSDASSTSSASSASSAASSTVSQTTSSDTTSVSETLTTSSDIESASVTSATSTPITSESSTTSQASETTSTTEAPKPVETTTERLILTNAPQPQSSAPSSKPTLTRTELVNSTESPSSIPLPQSNTSKTKSTTLTVLIVVASSVAGVAILWTVFRKWKLGRSSKFDERLQPIDWQPTNPDDGPIPGNRHRLSGASSFHSASGHGASSNRGFGASDHGHASEVSPASYAIPDHDFTAGPTTLAPVGGYADLARGPSPQPQMHQMNRGPSLTRQPYDVGVPLHHQAGYGTQDAYDYGGARRY